MSFQQLYSGQRYFHRWINRLGFNVNLRQEIGWIRGKLVSIKISLHLNKTSLRIEELCLIDYIWQIIYQIQLRKRNTSEDRPSRFVWCLLVSYKRPISKSKGISVWRYYLCRWDTLLPDRSFWNCQNFRFQIWQVKERGNHIWICFNFVEEIYNQLKINPFWKISEIN